MTIERPVVVGVGLTDESEYVLRKVISLTGDPARIIAVHVLERNPLIFNEDAVYVVDDLYEQMRQRATARLQALCTPLGITGMMVLEGHPAAALHTFAEAQNARVVAIGTHGLQGWRALLGETAGSIMRNTSNNVLAVLTRHDGVEPGLNYNNVLVAVDLSEEADQIIEEACRVRARYDGKLTLMSALRPMVAPGPVLDGIATGMYDSFLSEAEKQFKAHLQRLGEKYDIEDVLLAHGQPVREIHALAASIEADLIVLGTHGKGGLALLLGSTPNEVLHGVNCDVLAVRL